MSRKITPYVFLGLLAIVLFFILGVRYGQQVEKTNEVIDFMATLAPSPKATSIPTATQAPLSFSPYKHLGCGIELVRPSLVSIGKEGTDSATLTEKSEIMLAFSCAKNISIQTASPSGRITIQNITAPYTRKGRTLVFTITNPLNGKRIEFETREEYVPLLEKSLRFILR